MIESQGGIAGATVIDLFAGSGSFGLESLSRGAAHVRFIEKDRRALSALRANISHLGFGDRCEVIAAPVERVLPHLGSADIAFCDPPYALDVWELLLEHLDVGVLVGHAEFDIALGPQWRELRRRTYGRSRIVLATPAADAPERTP